MQANEAQLIKLLAATDAASVAVIKVRCDMTISSVDATTSLCKATLTYAARLQDVLNPRKGASMTFNEFMQQVDTAEGHLLWEASCSRHNILAMSPLIMRQA